ncbi:MAG: hypothetical protein Q4D02_02410 [Clostridia bacterium]|nr:hypothetical protein [Clostridia bacterium]
MKKKKINSILLGIIVALNILILTNLLQVLVVDNCINALYNSDFAVSESTDYDVVIATLTSNALKVSFIARVIYVIREIIVFIEVYYLIKLLGKKYYMSILKLQNTLFVMFVIEMLPSIYKLIQGLSFKLNNVLYLIFCLIVYGVFMYKWLVDKEEANKILEIREKRRTKNRKVSGKTKKIKV